MGRDTKHQEMDKVFPQACGETWVKTTEQHTRQSAHTYTAPLKLLMGIGNVATT